MKDIALRAAFASALVCFAGAASAGFVLEAVPAVQVPPLSPAAVVTPTAAPAPAAAVEGRNIDSSARVDLLARKNRQRVDLESRVTSRITQTGPAPAELQVLRGMGRDVTMEDALRQILPAGWSVYSDQDLPGGTVNWDGNRTWPMVLHAVLAVGDMRANIDWAVQEVMLFVPAVKAAPAPAPAAQVQPVASVPPAPGVVLLAAAAPVSGVQMVPGPPAGAPVPAVAPVPQVAPVPAVAPVPMPASKPAAAAPRAAAPVPAPAWTLSVEKTLRENLRTWASTAGWNLVWSATFGDNVIDYPVDAQVTFWGELLGVNGAMAKVIAAYSDADRPLEIEFFRGNKVVEVRLHRIPDGVGKGSGAQVPATPRLAQPTAARSGLSLGS